MDKKTQKYKCRTCFLFIDDDDIKFEDEKRTPKCPVCGDPVEKACINDHICQCVQDITGGIHYCPVCGVPTCPCGSEDVEVISRVTGYLQALRGFNSGKKQEVKDRHRYNIN
jgi:hypothetical protein